MYRQNTIVQCLPGVGKAVRTGAGGEWQQKKTGGQPAVEIEDTGGWSRG